MRFINHYSEIGMTSGRTPTLKKAKFAHRLPARIRFIPKACGMAVAMNRHGKRVCGPITVGSHVPATGSASCGVMARQVTVRTWPQQTTECSTMSRLVDRPTSCRRTHNWIFLRKERSSCDRNMQIDFVILCQTNCFVVLIRCLQAWQMHEELLPQQIRDNFLSVTMTQIADEFNPVSQCCATYGSPVHIHH